MRLCFGGVAIALAPLFIRFLLYVNNSLVYLLVTAANSGSLEASLGDSMLTSIRTGNAITTALVIAMFIYLFVKLNIKFIVRQFTIIIFTIFTPIAAALWIVNKNVTAAAIWGGKIVMNIFTSRYGTAKRGRQHYKVLPLKQRNVLQKPLTPEEIDKRLEKFFTTHDFMTKGDFYSLTGMTRTTATRHIRRLCDEGKLENKGLQKQPPLCV